MLSSFDALTLPQNTFQNGGMRRLRFPLKTSVTLTHATYGGASFLWGGTDYVTPGNENGDTIPAGQTSATFTIRAQSVGQATVTAYTDPYSFPEAQQASGTFVVTPDTKSPSPGNSPGGGGGGGQPQKCLICSGCVTSNIGLSSGNAIVNQSDPVATRGYPLVCNIHINSQTVESNRSMGNATFTYDIHLATQSVYGSNCTGASHWMVVDGDGSRLDFGPASGAPTPTAGIFSHLAAIAGGYQLQGAGPPEDLASAGNFTYTFNSLGQLTQINDPAGNAQMLNYDANNRLISVVDVSSQKGIGFQYTGNLITQVVANGGGATTTLAYQNGLLASSSVSNLFGPATSAAYNYNADGSMSSVVRDGDMASAVSFTYTAYTSSSCGAPILMANATDTTGSTHIAYGQGTSTNNAVASTWDTNAKGGITKFDFDAQGNTIRITMPTPTGATYAETITAQYDANHLLTQIQDNSGGASFTYDANGLLSTFMGMYGNTWTLTHSGADLTSVKTPVQAAQNKVETVAYGDPNQPHVSTGYTDASNYQWNSAHNVYGQTTQVTPPSGSPLGASSITYDERVNSPTLGYPLVATDGNGDVTTFDSYDSLGDLLQISTYPVHGNTTVKNTTTLTYDAAQRVTSVMYPDGHGSQTAYVGRHLDHTIDAANTRFDYFYCPSCDALTGISGPLGWTLGWTYDADHQLTDFWDANGHNTHYTYGSGGELTQLTYPDNTSLSFLYNTATQVRQMTNARGHQVALGYDLFQRLNQVSYPTSGQASTTYTYNTDDTPNTITDGLGTTTYTYAANGWVQSVVYNYSASGLSAAQELDYTYYPDGSYHTLTWKSSGTTVASWTYSYDAGGRLTGVSNNWNENTSWAYDGEGKLTGQTNANGTSLSAAYNQARGWPTSVTYSNSAGVFAGYSLSYDGGNNTVGNLTGVTEQDGSTASYNYDALYRLTGDIRTGTNANAHTYGYDLAGNITTVNGSTFATYDNANKISSLSGGTTSYDADGNLTGVSGTGIASGTFTWDDRNKAVQQSSGGVTVNYGYAASGLRTTSQVGSGTKTFYIYSGTTLLGEIQAGSSTPSAVYTWGATGLISERLTAANKSLWYACGPQGETRQLTDNTGAVVDTYAYSSYGVLLASTGSDANPFRYGGQAGYYTDANNPTGTILCGLRWYHPATGRFLNHDPIEYTGGANLYAYCGGNPVGSLDPLGLRAGNWLLKFGLETAAGMAGSTLNPIFGYALGVALVDGLWAHFMDNMCAKDAIAVAVKSFAFNAIAGIALQKVAGAIMKLPAVQQFLQKMGCEGGGFAAQLIRAITGQSCFVAGTPVWVAWQNKSGEWQVGTKRVEQVKQGEWVLSRNEQTGQTETKRVLQTTIKQAKSVITVTLADAQSGKVVESITASPEHPFFVEGKGFVPAGQLALGNAIVTRAGPNLLVKAVQTQSRAEGYEVYNLVVEDDHTYFVGKHNGGAWVHNPELCDKALALGLELVGGRRPWGDMQRFLGGFGPGGADIVAAISSPATQMEPFMQQAASIHFNLDGVNVNRILNGTSATSKEWLYLIGHSELWPKTTIYNVPAGLSVPAGIKIGSM